VKLFFVNNSNSGLADPQSQILSRIKGSLFALGATEVGQPNLADAILIQEITSFKEFRYIKKLKNDELISKFSHKVFTINSDDCATGLLRGLYTSLPRYRYNHFIHTSVPYMEYPNELIFFNYKDVFEPFYLAGWRGNTKSNKIRLKMIEKLQNRPRYQIETTDSWLNHMRDEKEAYVNLIRNSKFSLCPAGWAPVSFRIYESMALAKCPVIIADDFVPPKGPNWKRFALFFPEKKMASLDDFILKHESQYDQLGKQAYEAWQGYFSPDRIEKYYALSLINLIKKAPRCTRQSEISRWESLYLFWKNKWTMPQRFLNKIERWLVHFDELNN
jgi:hypothetical protein